MRLSQSQLGSFIERGVKALETIAKNIGALNTATTYNQTYVSTPGSETVEDSGKGLKLPAYLMPTGERVINVDEDTAHGYGRIQDDGFYIHIPAHYFTDQMRKIIDHGEPVAFTIGVNHRKPVGD